MFQLLFMFCNIKYCKYLLICWFIETSIYILIIQNPAVVYYFIAWLSDCMNGQATYDSTQFSDDCAH